MHLRKIRKDVRTDVRKDVLTDVLKDVHGKVLTTRRLDLGQLETRGLARDLSRELAEVMGGAAPYTPK